MQIKPFILLSAAWVLTLSTATSLAASPLKTGDVIPDTTVEDESGATLKLRELVRQAPSVLIFYRGGWCPYCTRHLSSLMEIEDDLRSAGYQILAISPDQPSKLAETPDREKLKYRLLSDSDMKTARAFGIAFEVDATTLEKYDEYGIDLEAASGQSHHLLPHPAVYVVAPDGTIRFAHVNEDYKVRLEPEKILAAAKANSGE